MSRATNNSASRQRRNKTLKMAKGYRGGRSKLNRTAQEAVNRSLAYAYRDRRVKKRTFRQLCYSRFMAGLKAAAVEIDRKVLADLAVNDEAGFARLAEIAKQNG